MMMAMREVSFRGIPKFVKLVKAYHGVPGGKDSSIKDIIDNVFQVSVERGLSDEELSMLLHFFCTSYLSTSVKLSLLQNLVPEKKIPSHAIRQFMAWFISNYRKKKNLTANSRILQWIIGLLENGLVDSGEINNFYYDFYVMFEFPSLVPFVAKLLCKLTKPDDVTSQTVKTLCSSIYDLNNKYLLAVLSVFKRYKPHLIPEDVRQVDVLQVLRSVKQTMDSVMRVRVISTRATKLHSKAVGIYEIPSRNFSYFKEESAKISSLIPLPIYNFEGVDKFGACYPNSVEQACRKFSRVPIPQNIISLLHTDAGFFTLMYRGIEVQMRFQNTLLQILQNALIYQDPKTSDEDVEYLFRRVYCLQSFMQQGIPSVSVFLSGYLLNWDGLDHRYSILKLIEWATFHSFKELVTSILRPLHMLFVTDSASMRKNIIQTLTNLIRNMFADVYRVQLEKPFPFMKRGPKWTKDPEPTLRLLVCWTQNLITLGLTMEKDSSTLLMESLRFFETINFLESITNVRMFTVVPEGVVLQCLLSQDPIMIIRICCLLLRYHKEFLPDLRREKPSFYELCKEKIGLTSNYAQRIIYFLQNGQVVLPRKENGVIIRDVPNESFAAGEDSFSPASHTCFVATYITYTIRKHSLNLSNPDDRRKAEELVAVHLKEIFEFVNYFSPTRIPEALQ